MKIQPTANGARSRITELDNEGCRLSVRWSDTHISHFPAIALRANCECDACGSYQTALRDIRLTDIPAGIEIGDVRLENGEVVVTWKNDGHLSRYTVSWLRSICNSPAERARRRWRPRLWGKEIETDIPSVNYERCASDEAARLDMLEAIRDYGFVVVRGVPADAAATKDIAELAGPLRTSAHGEIYDVRYDPDPEFYANTDASIAPHSDEAYRHSPPSITCFHFIRAAAEGGESTLTDSFRIAVELKTRDQAAFQLLARIPVTFHRRFYRQDKDYRMRAPIISLDDMGEIAGFRLLDRALGPIDSPEEDVTPYYEALRLLLEMLYDERNQAAVPLVTGEALFFNNHRVLHGRQAFDPGTGRHMRSCNVELDEFNSNLRQMARRLGRDGADMVLPHGTLS